LFLWLQSLSTYLASLFDTANTTGRSWHRHRCLHVLRVHRIFARRHVRGRVAPPLPVSSGVCRSHALGYLVFLGLAQSTRFHFLGSQGLSPSLRSKRAKNMPPLALLSGPRSCDLSDEAPRQSCANHPPHPSCSTEFDLTGSEH